MSPGTGSLLTGHRTNGYVLGMRTRPSTLLLVGSLALGLGCMSTLYGLSDGSTFRATGGTHEARHERGRVYVDGQPNTHSYDWIHETGVVLTPDGRFAYLGHRDGHYYANVDDREYGPYDDIHSQGMKSSPGGTRFVWSVWRDGRAIVVVDGVESPSYDGLFDGFVFSPDETRVAYAALDGARVVIAENGAEVIAGLALHMGPWGYTAQNELAVALRDVAGWRVYIDEWFSPPFDGLVDQGLAFDPERRTVTWVGTREGGVFVGYGTRIEGPYDSVGIDASRARPLPAAMLTSIALAPAGDSAAYVARIGEERGIYVDGNRIAILDETSSLDVLRFNATGQVLLWKPKGPYDFEVLPLPEQGLAPASAPFGSVRVTASSSPALVFVDGSYAGLAPITLDLDEGDHDLAVETLMRQRAATRVSVAAGAQTGWDAPPISGDVIAAVADAITRTKSTYVIRPEATSHSAWNLAKWRCAVPMDEIPLAVIVSSTSDATQYGPGYSGGGSGELGFLVALALLETTCGPCGTLVLTDVGLRFFNDSEMGPRSPGLHFVSYADYARAPRATEHPIFDVEIVPNLFLHNVSAFGDRKELVEFLDDVSRSVSSAAPPR